MNVSRFLDIKLCNQSDFLKMTNDDRFFDYVALANNVSLVLLDGQDILCRMPIFVSCKVFCLILT